MFDDLKHAWHQAVENFWTELHAGGVGPEARLRAMQRQVAAARSEQRRLDAELARIGTLRRAERDELEVCLRRERMALEIEDGETARVAGRYAERHQRRVAMLELKATALEEEKALLTHDIEEMDAALAKFQEEERLGAGAGGARKEILGEEGASSPEFDAMRERARERAAEERLEELKRRMR